MDTGGAAVIGRGRVCPHCGTALKYRLGMYQCTQCDYEEPEHPPEPEPQPKPEPEARAKMRKLPKWIPTLTLPVQDQEGGTGFAPGEFDEHARVATSALGNVSELTTEKVLVLGVMAVQSVLIVVLTAPKLNLMAFTFGELNIVGTILALALGLLMWGWVFFTRLLWVKYVFVLLELITALAIVSGIVMLLYYLLSDQMFPLLGWINYGLLFWIVAITSAFVSAWICWILLREIQYMTYQR